MGEIRESYQVQIGFRAIFRFLFINPPYIGTEGHIFIYIQPWIKSRGLKDDRTLPVHSCNRLSQHLNGSLCSLKKSCHNIQQRTFAAA